MAEYASPLAANPFESVLRGIAIDAGLAVQPQSPILLGSVTVHPDVVDCGRRLVIEAESWEWHSGKEAFAASCYDPDVVVRQACSAHLSGESEQRHASRKTPA